MKKIIVICLFIMTISLIMAQNTWDEAKYIYGSNFYNHPDPIVTDNYYYSLSYSFPNDTNTIVQLNKVNFSGEISAPPVDVLTLNQNYHQIDFVKSGEYFYIVVKDEGIIQKIDQNGNFLWTENGIIPNPQQKLQLAISDDLGGLYLSYLDAESYNPYYIKHLSINGQIDWSYEFIVNSNNVSFTTDGTNNLIAIKFLGTTGSIIYSINNNGLVNWQISKSGICYKPAKTNNNLIFNQHSSDIDSVFAISKNGVPQWTFNIQTGYFVSNISLPVNDNEILCMIINKIDDNFCWKKFSSTGQVLIDNLNIPNSYHYSIQEDENMFYYLEDSSSESNSVSVNLYKINKSTTQITCLPNLYSGSFNNLFNLSLRYANQKVFLHYHDYPNNYQTKEKLNLYDANNGTLLNETSLTDNELLITSEHFNTINITEFDNQRNINLPDLGINILQSTADDYLNSLNNSMNTYKIVKKINNNLILAIKENYNELTFYLLNQNHTILDYMNIAVNHMNTLTFLNQLKFFTSNNHTWFTYMMQDGVSYLNKVENNQFVWEATQKPLASNKTITLLCDNYVALKDIDQSSYYSYLVNFDNNGVFNPNWPENGIRTTNNVIYIANYNQDLLAICSTGGYSTIVGDLYNHENAESMIQDSKVLVNNINLVSVKNIRLINNKIYLLNDREDAVKLFVVNINNNYTFTHDELYYNYTLSPSPKTDYKCYNILSYDDVILFLFNTSNGLYYQYMRDNILNSNPISLNFPNTDYSIFAGSFLSDTNKLSLYMNLGNRLYVQEINLSTLSSDIMPEPKPFISNITNYPNPFNPETNISFVLNSTSPIQIDIYNTKGQKVKSLLKQTLNSGNHSILWNGKNDKNKSVASGLYFYKIKANHNSYSGKMLLIK